MRPPAPVAARAQGNYAIAARKPRGNLPRVIALATCRDLAALTADDRLFAEALSARGAQVVPAVWDDPEVAWDAFESVVIRSTWDYALRPAEFLAWAASVPRLWNPAPIVRWNADKRYLFDLEARGVPIAPTIRMAPGEDVGPMLDAKGWTRAVLKPVVGAAARGARVVEGPFEAREASLLQPFLPEIARGEWSFVFLGGAFSHAVHKRPAPGDFRVQEEHGGTVTAAEPSASLVAEARAVVECIEGPWRYARVDAVEVDGRLVVMELEAIEPELFFRFAPGSADRLAASILRA
jgi:glutathione synthase/RimK-type ligase-like ATP-grasp enzyme